MKATSDHNTSNSITINHEPKPVRQGSSSIGARRADLLVVFTGMGVARRERRPEEEMRRSRLLPGRGACSGCPRSITGARVIDVSARHSAREVGALMARACVTRRPARTQLDGGSQLKRPLGDMGPVAEGQPVTVLAGTLVDSHEGVQAR